MCTTVQCVWLCVAVCVCVAACCVLCVCLPWLYVHPPNVALKVMVVYALDLRAGTLYWKPLTLLCSNKGYV